MNFHEIQQKPAPCEDEECKYECPYGVVFLEPKNRFVWTLFNKLSGQVIVAGMGECLGIKFEAIDFLFDLYKINKRYERKILFDKLQLIDSIRMKSMRAAQKRIEQQRESERRRKR